MVRFEDAFQENRKSTTALWGGLSGDGMLLRVKLARPVSGERNRPDVIQRRINYANWFLACGVLNHCVFLDEWRYNIWTEREGAT